MTFSGSPGRPNRIFRLLQICLKRGSASVLHSQASRPPAPPPPRLFCGVLGPHWGGGSGVGASHPSVCCQAVLDSTGGGVRARHPQCGPGDGDRASTEDAADDFEPENKRGRLPAAKISSASSHATAPSPRLPYLTAQSCRE